MSGLREPGPGCGSAGSSSARPFAHRGRRSWPASGTAGLRPRRSRSRALKLQDLSPLAPRLDAHVLDVPPDEVQVRHGQPPKCGDRIRTKREQRGKPLELGGTRAAQTNYGFIEKTTGRTMSKEDLLRQAENAERHADQAVDEDVREALRKAARDDARPSKKPSKRTDCPLALPPERPAVHQRFPLLTPRKERTGSAFIYLASRRRLLTVGRPRARLPDTGSFFEDRSCR
ncbi:hypothetical protein ABIB73_000008 [Bradyrhizobium sp. F1.4.3]